MKITFSQYVRIALIATIALAAAPAALVSASTTEELQHRAEQRYPKVRELKSQGKVGETMSGTVEAVRGGLSKEQDKLLSDENADRQELYRLIAQKRNLSVDEVAHNAAVRNFERAGKGEYLKDEKGEWTQKK